jgi:general secretion pathway protein K
VARDQLIAEAQARSAVNLARVVLNSEPVIRRTIAPILTPLMAMMGRGLAAPPQIPVWEQADLIIGPVSLSGGRRSARRARAGELRHREEPGRPHGLSPVVIIDEDSRINVNSAVRSSVAQILLGGSSRGSSSTPGSTGSSSSATPTGSSPTGRRCISNVIDYIDFDETTFDAQSLLASTATAASTAPEDSFYQRLRPPGRRRNAPLDSIEELRMIRGFGDDDLWHAVVDPDPANPRRRTLTVWGQGAVNVNTANAQTLLALVCAYSPDAPQCQDLEQASAFITTITMVQGSRSPWASPCSRRRRTSWARCRVGLRWGRC